MYFEEETTFKVVTVEEYNPKLKKLTSFIGANRRLFQPEHFYGTINSIIAWQEIITEKCI